jgi:PadR family transcriptional regulator PadR
MTKQSSLGQFEQLVLTAILAQGDNAYGVTIAQAVEEMSQPKRVALGPVYVTLDRLEEKGLVESWLSEPTRERGGRSKRHYRLRKAGEKALRQSAMTAHRMCEVVEQNWGEKIWNANTAKWKPAHQK